MKCYGLDCHSDNLKMVVFNENGKLIKKQKIMLQSDQFASWLKSLSKEDYVALEASTNSFKLHDMIAPYVNECYVLNQRRMPEIYNTPIKTDYRDAEKICERLWLAKINNLEDTNRFPQVFVPKQNIRNLRVLFTSQKAIRAQIVTNKNKVHAFIKQEGKVLSREFIDKKKAKEMIEELHINPVIQIQISIFLDIIRGLQSKMKEIEDLIMKEGQEFREEVTILTSVPGISNLGALAMVSDIADIGRFSNYKRFCSYLRTAPGLDSSNKKTHVKHINKCSRSLSLFYLIQGINHICRANDVLSDFYIEKKKGKKAGKVRIAACRKTTVHIYFMLRDKKLYRYMNSANHQKKIMEYDRFLAKIKKSA